MEIDMEIDMETDDESLLVKKFEKHTLNDQENMTSASSKLVPPDVILKKMIEDTEKIWNDPMTEEIEKICHDFMIEDRKNLFHDPKYWEIRKKILDARHNKLMLNWYELFQNEPRLEKTCKDIELVFSNFTSYDFKASSNVKSENLVDLKYSIEFCGYNLRYLDVTEYLSSQIMPLINTYCPGLEDLAVTFEEIKDEDFKDVFCNMHKLEKLFIKWKCERSTLPMTLVKSLEKVGATLKELDLRCESKDGVFLLDSLVPVFPRFIALERLHLYFFRLNQTVIESISEITSITDLLLIRPHDHPIMVIEKINLSPIGNLKNLKKLYIRWGCSTDELLIKLADNAKKLEEIRILGTNVTDNGIFAVQKMSQLQQLYLGLDRFHRNALEKPNKYVTDKSIECLFNEKLWYLDLSNCTEISNRSVIKAFENLPGLSVLCVDNTNVTIEVVEELSKLTKFHENKLHVCVSFKDCNGIFKSLIESHNVEFRCRSSEYIS